jgi:hypothetical protein
MTRPLQHTDPAANRAAALTILGDTMAFIWKKRAPNGAQLYQVVRKQMVGGKLKEPVLIGLSHNPTITGRIESVAADLAGLRGTRRTGDEGAVRHSEDMLARLHRVQAETGLP